MMDARKPQMGDPNTEIGGADQQLPATSHTAFAALRGADPVRREEELARLVKLYWKPVYCLVRRTRSSSNEDAKDLTQDFFAEVIVGGGLVDQYEPGKGTFRAYLKGALRNFLSKRVRDASREKRGGGAKPLSLDFADADLEQILPDGDALSPEEAFDSAWRNEVLVRATGRLEDQLKAQGKGLYFEVFKRYDLEEGGETLSYEDLGRQLRLSADDVKNYLTRTRQEFRHVVRAILAESVENPEGLAEEWNALFGGG
jgi:RNA polymerase sigma factor (sigma-70 family)